MFEVDTRAAVIRAHVGFEKVGDLPTRYEGVNRIIAGYDSSGAAILAVGGYDGATYNLYAEYVDDVLVLRWDEREGVYVTEQGPTLSYADPSVPAPRYGVNLAFDGAGCGVMAGGDARLAVDDARFVGDVWRICSSGGVYEWEQINLAPVVENETLYLLDPILWDPLDQRYVVVGGEHVLYLRARPGSGLVALDQRLAAAVDLR